MVCLHGSFADGGSFDPVLARWKPQSAVVAYDLPGHGGSPLPPGPVLSIDAAADLVAGACDRDGIRQATLLGHSWGGVIAVRLARRRPDLVANLVLMGIDVSPDEPTMQKQKREALAVVAQHGLAPFVEVLLAMFFAPGFLADPRHAPVIAAWRQQLAAFPSSIAPVMAGIIDRPDLSADAAALTMPVWLIDGEEDQMYDASCRARCAAAFPQARRHVLAGVGHTPQVEDPTQLAAVLRAEGIGR